jgi:predicted membrane chloride channel (bestrophin family)
MSAVFYVNGINTLIGLIGFVEPWFSWTYGLFLSVSPFILLFVVFGIMLKFRPKPEIVEMKILYKK